MDLEIFVIVSFYFDQITNCHLDLFMLERVIVFHLEQKTIFKFNPQAFNARDSDSTDKRLIINYFRIMKSD